MLQGWLSQNISTKLGEIEQVLYYKNPLMALSSLFSSTKNAEGFKLCPSTVKSGNGERIFTTPDTCLWWEAMQVIDF